MNRYLGWALLVGLLLWAGNVGAKEITLNLGETYRQGDLSVTCGEPAPEMPLAIRACQYWDDFNKKCLFEKTTYSHGNLECVEECQHWDAFYATCHYQTTCTFYPAQRSFVRTACEKFDDFNKSCVQTRETKIAR
jgi:hypothetical protein